MKTALITGVTGQDGSYLSEFLLDKSSTYVLGIREGGSYNIWMSCKRLMKLSSIADVRAFYERIDAYINRADYIHYTKPAYCWTWWTKLCLKHKKIAIMLVAIGQWGYKAMRR